MSSLLFSASITLVLLSILSVSTADPVLDIDGNPISNRGSYYIIPVTTTSKSGLTYTEKEDQCPLYITKETTENSPGTPVRISSEARRTSFISLDETVSLTINSFSTPCHTLLSWDIKFDRFGRNTYVTAGGSRRSMDKYLFTIAKKDNSPTSTYELKYGTRTSLGFYEDDGLLGFAPNPTLVSFKKEGYYLELPTTSKIQ